MLPCEPMKHNATSPAVLSLPVTPAQIGAFDRHPARFSFALPNGLLVTVSTERDDTSGTPWERSEGHGPVSNWERRDKRSGERLLSSDGPDKRFYDYAEAIRIAKRDGWGVSEEVKAKLAAKLGRAPTKGEIAAQAVERDFEFLRSWCADEWEYLGVTVTLKDSNGKTVAEDSLWGIESCENPGYGYYWHEVAAEMVNTLGKAQEEEVTERAHWEARDTVTLPA